MTDTSMQAPQPPAPTAPPADPTAPIIAQTSDGVHHVFPAGTPDDVIDRTIAQYVQQQAPGYQQATKDAQAAPDAPIQRDVVNALTFNNADRLAGGVAALNQGARNLFGADGQPTMGQAYDATQDVENQRSAQFAKDHPYVNFATNIAATGLNPVVGAAGRFVAGAGSLGGAMVRSAITGAPIGAAFGAGADKSDPVGGAEMGAVVGGAMGAGAPIVARAAAAGAGIVTNKVVTPALDYAKGVIGDVASSPAFDSARAMVNNAGTSPALDFARSIINPSSAPDIAAARATSNTASAATQFASKYDLNNPATIARIQANPDVQSGAPVTLAETLGRSAVGGVRALATHPGPAADTVVDTLADRQYGLDRTDPLGGETGRLLDNVAESTGINPSTALTDHASQIAQGRDEVNPAYAAIRANPEPVPQSVQMTDLIAQDPHIQRVLNFVNNETRGGIFKPIGPESAPGAGDAPQGLNTTDWLAVRQTLADSLKRDPETGVVPNTVRQQGIKAATTDLTAHLNDAIPGFQAAQAEAAQYKAPEAAFDNATGKLFGNTAGKSDVPAVQNLVDNLNTPDERTAVQRAFMNDIQNQANNGRNLPGYLARPGVRQKLAIVFDPEIADNIQQGALSAQRLAGRSGAAGMSPNAGSQTAETLAHQADSPLLDIAAKTAEGAFHGGAEGAAKAASTGIFKAGVNAVRNFGQNPAYRDYAIGQLMTPADQFLQNYTPAATAPRSVLLSPGFARFGTSLTNQEGQR